MPSQKQKKKKKKKKKKNLTKYCPKKKEEDRNSGLINFISRNLDPSILFIEVVLEV